MSEILVDSPETGDVVPAGADIAEPSSDEAASELSDLEREILAFERKWWRFAGAKEEAVRELFDMTSTRYYQVLNALIDTPAALAHDPMLVKRLRRMRSTRQRARSARRLADEKP
ncbi:DUF3263 domain-containing protein [Myceligenerans indicum]|uniref:DUF3263 domain-containing protein n=1 Tax=Myceligenerans indicum TaxID=2593663 RepID=A0ABS1LS13_9MICO|nr:DUF3263 domain-containing protein [Myceligenerans indicum]MBL0888804.1 DUF3263 domain-containing protein [Myceligenerans indicum]